MRSHSFALFFLSSLLIAVLVVRGRARGHHGVRRHHGGRGRHGGRGHHAGSGRARFGGGYDGGYGDGGYGIGYGASPRNHDQNDGGRGDYYIPPVPPTNECKPPCEWSYGLPGQEMCSCPSSTIPTIPTTRTTPSTSTTPTTMEVTSTTPSAGTKSTTPTTETTSTTSTSPSTSMTPTTESTTITPTTATTSTTPTTETTSTTPTTTTTEATSTMTTAGTTTTTPTTETSSTTLTTTGTETTSTMPSTGTTTATPTTEVTSTTPTTPTTTGIPMTSTTLACTPNGVWSEWKEGVCENPLSITCGLCGNRNLTRTCISEPACPCNDVKTSTQRCEPTPCDPELAEPCCFGVLRPNGDGTESCVEDPPTIRND